MLFIIPLNINPLFVFRYMKAIVDENIAPNVSIMRSPIVSRRPDFCIFNPRVWSIVNSKISHIVPIAIAKEKENIAMAHGLVFISCLLAMKYRTVNPRNPNTIADPA